MPDPVYISTQAFAERLGMARVSVRAAIRRGILPAVKVGRDWIIDEREVAWYELAHRQGDRRRPQAVRRR